MIKRLRIAVVLLVFVLGPCSVAHAGFIDWIDELSGPGPFWGVGGDIRLACTSVPNEVTPPPNPSQVQKVVTSHAMRWLTFSRCLLNDVPPDRRPSVSLDVTLSYARSFRNDLQYPAGTGDTHVSVFSWAPTVWWNPIPPVGVGTGVGVNTFQGPTFSTFSRFYINPVQVEIKPFAFSKDRWLSNKASWFTLRAGYELIPKGFDATDFGAIPGTFHTGHEVLPKVMILVDGGQWSWLR